jgi:hypothetical protein
VIRNSSRDVPWHGRFTGKWPTEGGLPRQRCRTPIAATLCAHLFTLLRQRTNGSLQIVQPARVRSPFHHVLLFFGGNTKKPAVGGHTDRVQTKLSAAPCVRRTRCAVHATPTVCRRSSLLPILTPGPTVLARWSSMAFAASPEAWEPSYNDRPTPSYEREQKGLSRGCS